MQNLLNCSGEFVGELERRVEAEDSGDRGGRPSLRSSRNPDPELERAPDDRDDEEVEMDLRGMRIFDSLGSGFPHLQARWDVSVSPLRTIERFAD